MRLYNWLMPIRKMTPRNHHHTICTPNGRTNWRGARLFDVTCNDCRFTETDLTNNHTIAAIMEYHNDPVIDHDDDYVPAWRD